MIILIPLLVTTELFAAEHLNVPIQLEYSLLSRLMDDQLFGGQDERLEILQDTQGCNKMFISDVRLREHRRTLAITIRIEAKLATGIFGACIGGKDWQGQAEFFTKPFISVDGKAIGFQILTTRLKNLEGQMIDSGQMWSLIDGLQALLGNYQVDLEPTLHPARELISSMLTQYSKSQIRELTDSLRLTEVQVGQDSALVNLKLLAINPQVTSDAQAPSKTDPQHRSETNWQMIDALMTYVVKQYADATSHQTSRDRLLEALLDRRYRLNDALSDVGIDDKDSVREWFYDSWRRIGPELHKIDAESSDRNPLTLLSVLTAIDVLRVLDRFDPSIRPEISGVGLRRMSRLLFRYPETDPLEYDLTVDPQLRRLMRLSESFPPDNAASRRSDTRPIGSDRTKSQYGTLKLQVPDKNELPEYLPLVRELIHEQAGRLLQEYKLEDGLRELYRHLVLTTAWQESCWRQYKVENNKVVPLGSGNGKTGLMQMNELVWRGFYDIKKLRWDISDNVRSGAEVLLLYLTDYAVKRAEMDQPGEVDNLARSTYSAYNGGPSQIDRYRNPEASAKQQKIDEAFWHKYQEVKRGRELQVAECLAGEGYSLTGSTSKQVRERDTAYATPSNSANLTPETFGKEWILNQDEQWYTLQMGVFSSSGVARRFVDESQLAGSVAISPMNLGKDKRLLVLYGSYRRKTDAILERRRLKKFKPWVRSFKDVQKSLSR